MAVNENWSQKSKWKYHVFLSFRGEDTRLGFTDHLHKALVDEGIITFRDEEGLERGEVISQKLFDAIAESLSAIVIFSENYASSSWCLNELQEIVESNKRLGPEIFPIFPIFYGVDTSDVRHQMGSFAEAFKNHEIRLLGNEGKAQKLRDALKVVANSFGWDFKNHKHEEKIAKNKAKLQKWRDALTYAADQAGWHYNNQHQTELIKSIVTQVWAKIKTNLPEDYRRLFGIDRRIEDMNSLLSLRLEEVRFIGIWGMAGIGKTTLARAIFNEIESKFDVSCFLEDVGKVSRDRDGLINLQKELLSHTKAKEMAIKTLDQGMNKIRNVLHNKKVLLVLDNVDAQNQLENLAGNQDWFGLESRVIVTTRDKHPLKSYRVQFEIYGIKILDNAESFKLFCDRAFKGGQPEKDYLVLSKSVVEYAGGLPMALDVLGSDLCGRSLQEWEDVLHRIKQVPPDCILDILRMSYDKLDDEYKTIFLDIASFFKGWRTDRVTQILQICGLHPTIGINILVEKSLVTCNKGILGMHDLFEQMGKTIAIEKGNRLWSLEDIDEVLRKNEGTNKVRGIVLNSLSTHESNEPHWEPEAFAKMCNLEFLIIKCDLHLPLDLKCLPSSLKVLEWWRYPLKALPLGVQLDKLVDLVMINSRVKQLWNGTQYLRKLKFVDMSGSEDLIRTPDISGVPNLEVLRLDYCKQIVEVHQSTAHHKKLQRLSLKECSNLKILPRKLEMNSLRFFDLSGCSKVAMLPEFGEKMESVSEIHLWRCENLFFLPDTIGNLKSLNILDISYCSKVSRIPESIIENKDLKFLDLSGTGIREVNASLVHLKNLKRLSFSRCRDLASNSWLELRKDAVPTSLMLPPSFSGLLSLTELDLSYCNLSDESIRDDLGCLPSLEILVLSGNNFVNPPSHWIANLPQLHCLWLEGCPMLQSLPDLPPHVHLYADHPQNQIDDYLLDPDLLWSLLESRYNKMADWFDPLHFITVGESSTSSSVASIRLDIPDYCCSNNWWGFWGIVVCLASDFEPTHPLYLPVTIKWSAKYFTPEGNYSFNVSNKTGRSCTFIFFTSGNYVYMHILHRGVDYAFIHETASNKGTLTKYRRPPFSENSKLVVEVKNEGSEMEIRKCGWRVLCEEDVEELQKLMSVKLRTTKFIGDDHFLVLQEATVNELEIRDAAAINKQKGGFSLRKLLGLSAQGLCLTALTLASMMVGFRMFLSPKQGFKLDTTSRNASQETSQLPKVPQSHRTTSVVRKPQMQRNGKTSPSPKMWFSGGYVPRRSPHSHSYHGTYHFGR